MDVSAKERQERRKFLARFSRWFVPVISIALIAVVIVSIWFGLISSQSKEIPTLHQTISAIESQISLQVSTSRETVSPTESPTSTQLSTPQFIPGTSQAILIEDHFDTQRSEGSYNGLLWNCWGCSAELVFQQDGVFQITVHSSPEAAGPGLASLNSWKSTEIGYIEAKLKLQDYEGSKHADVHAQLWADFQDYQWWTSCDVLIEPNMPYKGYFSCHDGRLSPNGTVTGDYATPLIPINPDEWQLVRIEIEPETFRLNFYLNGEIIGTRIPADADLLKSKDLTSVFGTWTEGMSTFTAYMDDLIVAP